MLVIWCGSCGLFVCSSSVYHVGVLGGHSFWMSVSPLVVLSILLVSLVSYRHFIMWMFYELHGDVCTCGLSLSLPRVSTVGKLRLVVVAVQGAPRPLFSLAKHKYLPQATLFTGTLGMQCFLHPEISISVYPLAVKLNRKPTCADPCTFACDWPGPRGKDYNLAKLRTEAQLHHLPNTLLQPLLKTLPFRLWKQDQDNCADPPCCKWTGSIIPVPKSSTPSDLVIGSLSLGQRRAMAAALQVFFQHCFCSAYSQHMRPTSGDTIICPCTYSQSPLPMTKLDRDGNPRPQTKATQDWLGGRLSIARPYAMPCSIVSIPNQGASFEALLAEQHANPHATPSHSPSPAQGSARL